MNSSALNISSIKKNSSLDLSIQINSDVDASKADLPHSEMSQSA